MRMTQEKTILIGDEIDLLEVFKVVWSKKIYIVKVVSLFILLGLAVGFTSKVEYESSCKLLPEGANGESPNLGGLGGLAGLAGINLNLGPTDGLSTQLYPEVVKSTPFLSELVNEEIFFERLDTTTTSFIYFRDLDSPTPVELISQYTIGLPGKIIKLFRDSNKEPKRYGYTRFTESDWDIIEGVSGRIDVLVDEEIGTIRITSEMPDPVAAAQLTDLVVSQLTKKISEYKTEKSRINLEFISGRFNEGKAEYEQKQVNLARFIDQNRNISNAIVQNHYERLQNEMNISFEVYKSLAAQLEQAKIKLKEDTPVFTFLEPIKIPEDKSKPRRLIILLTFIFIGVFFSTGKIILNALHRN